MLPKRQPIRIGSLFSGIGGFELGVERALHRAGYKPETLFQVEQNKFCQRVLKKHWPQAERFNDIRDVGRHNLPNVDVLLGGFPCIDISIAGKERGIKNGKKSNIWFEMLRVISELRPRIVVIENTANIVRVGGPLVVGGLTNIGYDSEWTIVSAAELGAPHIRRRWFCVATDPERTRTQIQAKGNESSIKMPRSASAYRSFWSKGQTESPVCLRDNGISTRLDRFTALGNAIVPQCSEYVFSHVINSIL